MFFEATKNVQHQLIGLSIVGHSGSSYIEIFTHENGSQRTGIICLFSQCFLWYPSPLCKCVRENSMSLSTNTLLETNISFSKGTFQDDVPFPVVGYVSSLKGRFGMCIYRNSCVIFPLPFCCLPSRHDMASESHQRVWRHWPIPWSYDPAWLNNKKPKSIRALRKDP